MFNARRLDKQVLLKKYGTWTSSEGKSWEAWGCSERVPALIEVQAGEQLQLLQQFEARATTVITIAPTQRPVLPKWRAIYRNTIYSVLRVVAGDGQKKGFVLLYCVEV